MAQTSDVNAQRSSAAPHTRPSIKEQMELDRKRVVAGQMSPEDFHQLYRQQAIVPVRRKV